MEVWKSIKGYDGIYEVSNMGRVRSYMKKDGWAGYKVTDTPHLMSTIPNGNGYMYVTLSKGCKRENKYIHRLVAEAFIGDIPQGYVINHIDYDKANNQVGNLEIVTQRQNVGYSRHKMCKPRKRDANAYICYRERNNVYEVTVRKKYLGKFKTLEEARSARDAYIEEINYY
jgi:hypothetical protein